MLDKLKGIGSQAVDGIATTVKGSVESIASSASSMTDALNEKAVRASTAQMCSILAIAMEELKSRSFERRVALTATVNVGIASLEMQVVVEPAATALEQNPVGVTQPIDSA